MGKRKYGIEDYIGKQFGKWTVIGDGPYKNHMKYFSCQCSCDNKTIKDVLLRNLINGSSSCCGCLEDHTGKQFGRLTVLRRIESSKCGKRRYECQCSCPDKTVKDFSLTDLKKGKVSSCGCYRRELKSKDFEPYIGQKFYEWTILGLDRDKWDHKVFVCECSCDNKTISKIQPALLFDGSSKCCGCDHKIQNIIGQKYERLTITEEIEKDSNGKRQVLAICDCDSNKPPKNYRLEGLRSGNTTNCGCKRIEHLRRLAEETIEDFTGREFGRLTIISEVEREDKTKQRRVLAQCECSNNLNEYSLYNLVYGTTVSCGCYARERLIEVRTYSKKDYEEKHPFFCTVEEIMDDPNVPGILVRCKKCNEWMKPTTSQIQCRVKSLVNPKRFEENNFYCGDNCRKSCDIWGRRTDPFETKEQYFTPYELKIFKEEVKLRQRNEFGYNFCEIGDCEDPGPYIGHHEIPKKREWIFGLDPDNGMVVCREHHNELHKGKCSTGYLANLKCK